MSLSKHWYTAYGLVIQSDLDLPELHTTPIASPDITIAAAPIAWTPDKIRENTWTCEVQDDGTIYLSSMDIGSFEISADGSRIAVDAAAGAAPDYLRIALLGSVLAFALRNRGFLILHATAVQVAGKAVLFMGQSGAGKSTMASMMHQLGHPLIADDVVAIRVDRSGNEPLMVPSGIDRCKLWSDSAEALGYKQGKLAPLYPGTDKLNVPLAASAAEDFDFQQYPLGSLFVLATGDQIEIQPISKNDAILELLAYSYFVLVNFRHQRPFAGVELLQSSRVAREAALYTLARPDDLALLPDVARQVERYLQGSPTADARAAASA